MNFFKKRPKKEEKPPPKVTVKPMNPVELEEMVERVSQKTESSENRKPTVSESFLSATGSIIWTKTAVFRDHKKILWTDIGANRYILSNNNNRKSSNRSS